MALSYIAARPKRDEALARPAPPHDPGSVLDRHAVIRAFVAFDLDAATLAEATRLVAELRAGPLASTRASWMQTARMHVTVRFLGDVEEALARALGEGLTGLGASLAGPLWLRARALGAFSSARHANVLTVPLEVDEAARDMARRLEELVTSAGLPAEGRPWVPHLTLARFRAPVDVREVVRTTGVTVDGWATGLTLYRSTLGASGPTYEALARARLPM